MEISGTANHRRAKSKSEIQLNTNQMIAAKVVNNSNYLYLIFRENCKIGT
jgi:hypothetical protein